MISFKTVSPPPKYLDCVDIFDCTYIISSFLIQFMPY